MGRKLRMLGVLGFGESDSLEEVAMVTWTKALIGVVVASTVCGLTLADDPHAAKETSQAGPGGVKLTVRMQGPYDAEVPLQVVCYFKHKESGDTTIGAAVELDKKLGGVIASLRSRGEFAGDELETLLLIPPEGTIKPKALLLIGLGDEASLSLDRMEQVGRVALREAARLGVKCVAFAPLIRDQGNSKLGAGEVAAVVVRGMLLARDTEIRLQKEGLAKAHTIEEWVCEAGPKYFDETVSGVRKAMKEADSAIAARPPAPYVGGKK
jgi:Cytosol aminopeptidase family, N-terminal domain